MKELMNIEVFEAIKHVASKMPEINWYTSKEYHRLSDEDLKKVEADLLKIKKIIRFEGLANELMELIGRSECFTCHGTYICIGNEVDSNFVVYLPEEISTIKQVESHLDEIKEIKEIRAARASKEVEALLEELISLTD